KKKKKKKFLRQHTTIFVIPMLNPDGVYTGNYRSTSLGNDLNREWQNPNWKAHPTISAVKYLLRQLDHHNRKTKCTSKSCNNNEPNKKQKESNQGTNQWSRSVGLDYYIDVHGHTNANNAFMYCNQNLSAQDPASRDAQNDFITLLPRLWEAHCQEFSFAKSKFCANPKKAGSARRAMEAVLSDVPICYTFEVSFFKSNERDVYSLPYTKETCYLFFFFFLYFLFFGVKCTFLLLLFMKKDKNIGRALVQALTDVYFTPPHLRRSLMGYGVEYQRLMKGDLRRYRRKKAMTKKVYEVDKSNKNKFLKLLLSVDCYYHGIVLKKITTFVLLTKMLLFMQINCLMYYIEKNI
ncbi:hypothetical protein RFI_05422, partial [Reticulomyxa filosa]